MLARMTITVREAITDDLPALAALWHEKTLLQADRRLRLAPDARASWIEAAGAWLTDPKRALFVALDEDAPVGYAAGGLREMPGMMPAHIGVIDDFALDAHRYHGGAGRLLASALRRWFAEQGVECCAAWLPRNDAVAQAFWRSLGGEDWINILWLK